jgi:8-hydroxy-5-deazaflavin:NADPH oxidoreductase
MSYPQPAGGDGTGNDQPAGLGIIGGTGALGRGLALRWSMAGIEVRLGSREEHRARDTASTLHDRLGDRSGIGRITGHANADVAASAQLLVLSVPMAGLEATLEPLRERLDGRILICAVNPLGFGEEGPMLVPGPIADTSVAGAVAAAVPGARVVAAFHTVSSRELASLDRPMDDDVPVVGDDDEACAVVAALADRIEGCRGVVAGPLHLASSLEALTPVLIAINQRRSTHVGVRFSRLPPVTDATGGG